MGPPVVWSTPASLPTAAPKGSRCGSMQVARSQNRAACGKRRGFHGGAKATGSGKTTGYEKKNSLHPALHIQFRTPASRRTRTKCNRGLRSGRRGLSLHKPASEEPPPRRILVSLGGLLTARADQLRISDLGYPRAGRDPSQIDFRLRQGGNAPRVRLLSYVTQRSPFRLPG